MADQRKIPNLTLFLIAIISCSFTPFFSVAQSEKSKFEGSKYSNEKNEIKIDWLDVVSIKAFNGNKVEYLHFKGALYNAPQSFLPYYSFKSNLKQNTKSASFKLIDPVYKDVSDRERKILETLNYSEENILIDQKVKHYRKSPFLRVNFIPIRKNTSTGRYEKLVSFNYSIDNVEEEGVSRRASNLSFKAHSVLSSGRWDKVGLTKDGVYKVDFAFLSKIGALSGSVQSSSIRLFGNGGGMLPFDNDSARHDDLVENAIEMFDGGDGSFDAGDFFLFYGQGQHRWKMAGSTYIHDYNFMADTTYYFITKDYQVGQPKRIQSRNNSGLSPDITVSDFDDYQFSEVNTTNFVKSGRRWFGEHFSKVREKKFSFKFSNIQSSSASINFAAASRAIDKQSSFSMTVNGSKLSEMVLPGVFNYYEAPYVSIGEKSATFVPNSEDLNLTVNYASPSFSDEGWLDYIEVVVKRNLVVAENPMFFRNKLTKDKNVARYIVSGVAANTRVWDVSDPTTVINQLYHSNGASLEMIVETNKSLKQYVVLSGTSFPAPESFGTISNQDLHALPQTDYVILTHPKFINQAEKLAGFHRNNSNLKVAVVTTSQVYNEFSSGAQDITAIKSLMKMFYDRAGSNKQLMPKYLLLFGDASYDYKYVLDNNTNYIPGFQSRNSHNPVESFISDDYFGFLDDSEGDAIDEILDIGIGRFPVKTVQEAENAVNKVLAYHKKPSSLGRWRNWVTFIGDDEDSNIHMKQANNLAKKIEDNHGVYNVKKIMFDAYPQESSFGGESYPGVNKAINDAVERGTVLLTYVGHGGELGWAHERVLNISDINSWKNKNSMPLFLTATCEFSRFDDPARTSAGEYVFLNPNGGGIGMLTTTRLVYSSPNYELSKSFMDHVFNNINGKVPTFGDLLREVKDRNDLSGSTGINYRNFSLLGDPAIRLPVAQYDIKIESVKDTIKALEKVTIKGYVSHKGGAINTSFNGTVYPTVFDRIREVKTLNNDKDYGEFPFNTQTDVIFRGRAKVTAGRFEFSFIVPKDVSFEYGKSRISLYAEDGTTDAQGYYDKFQIGGISDNVVADNKGPDIDLWMNDSTFVRGGMTDPTPTILAKVFDESGINTVGKGVGHDIVAVIDANSSNAIVLNDHYESELNTYKRGTIKYPLSKLAEGKHTLSLKVWDVHNNSSIAETEFVVANDANLAIDHVLNYPNPFTTNTGFFFEHNAPGQELAVTIQIFSVSGKLVKVLHQNFVTEGYRVGPVQWDGRDDFGDKIGKGVYVYKVKVSSSSKGSTEEFEKLVILN